MVISLIHPSRGRANQAFKTRNNWIKKASGKYVIEHLLSVDESDSQKEDYRNNVIIDPKITTLYIGSHDSVVEATNEVAKKAIGDILIYLSDDFDCPQNWDEKVVKSFEGCNYPALIKVHDGYQDFKAEVLTIPIMNKALYDKLGYFWHPSYRSMWVDVDLYHTVEIHAKMIRNKDLVFEHHHYVNGKAQKDETYTRSDANWNQGKAAYEDRKRKRFPL